MKILGIDPGLAKLGWGVIEAYNQKVSPVAYGVIRTFPPETLEKRIFAIHREFKALLDRYEPDAVGLEDIYFFKNVSSAIPVAKVIGALGITAMNQNIPISTFSPLQIKTALTGVGRAEKHQIQEMVRLMLGLQTPPKPDHAADALAAAICYYNHTLSRMRMG